MTLVADACLSADGTVEPSAVNVKEEILKNVSIRTHKIRQKTHRAACLVALLGGLLIVAPARAAHYTDEGSACYGCHTLDARQSDPDTSAINMVARTLPQLRASAGGRAPERFGCTFCHSNPGNQSMREALTHFGAKPSRHPVGFNFTSGADTANEYLSTIGSATPGELDCVDCHDADLLAPDAAEGSYVQHAAVDDPRRAENPLMLLGVAARGKYDGFCRRCHGSAAPPVKGKDVRLVSHADAATAPILERDGTPLRTTVAGGEAQCTACHDTHYSGKVKLLNDGHEGDVPIVSSDCTAVCHFVGDPEGNFAKSGHGAARSTYTYVAGKVNFGRAAELVAMEMTCTSCHQSIDTSDTSRGRVPHVDRRTEGSPQERYRAAYGLNLPLQMWDAGSSFGNPLVGICYSCHAASDVHKAKEGQSAGCLDCHDEHAEGVGKNVFMIRAATPPAGGYVAAARPRAGGERVQYEVTRLDPEDGRPNDPLDFFRGSDPNGICDVAECHPGYTSLEFFMDENLHTDSREDPGSDCGACHRHSGDPAGGWRATSPPEQ